MIPSESLFYFIVYLIDEAKITGFFCGSPTFVEFESLGKSKLVDLIQKQGTYIVYKC